MEDTDTKECIYNGGIVMGVGDMEWCKLTGGYCGGSTCYMYMETKKGIEAIEIYRRNNLED